MDRNAEDLSEQYPEQERCQIIYGIVAKGSFKIDDQVQFLARVGGPFGYEVVAWSQPFEGVGMEGPAELNPWVRQCPAAVAALKEVERHLRHQGWVYVAHYESVWWAREYSRSGTTGA